MLLADGLRHSRTLRELYLFGNRVGDEGAVALASVLALKSSDKCPLHTLVLAENGIGDAGAQALASALAMNPLCTLDCLDLGGNRIGDAGAAALAVAIGANSRLKDLFLWHNSIRCATTCASYSVHSSARNDSSPFRWFLQ